MASGSEHQPSPIDPHMASIEAAELHYLGPAGSFSHLAAVALSKQGIHLPGSPEQSPELVEHYGFNGITYFVSHDPDHSAVGLLPLEDPESEPVNEVQTALFSEEFVVIGETEFLVRYQLVGVDDKLENIKHVHSHIKGLTRGRHFISEHGLRPIPESSTSEAAKVVAELADPEHAALCSLSAAQLYDLKIIESNVGWVPRGDNRTKFVLVRARNGGPPRLQYLKSNFQDDEIALVTGIVAPKRPTSENGYLYAMRYVVDASDNAIVPITRGLRRRQVRSVGGDAQYLETFRGKAKILNEVLTSEEFNKRTKLRRLGIYPVATQCEEPADGLYPEGSPLIDLIAIESEERAAQNAPSS